MRYEIVQIEDGYYVREVDPDLKWNNIVYHEPKRSGFFRKKIVGSRHAWVTAVFVKEYCKLSRDEATVLFSCLVKEDEETKASCRDWRNAEEQIKNAKVISTYNTDSAEIQVEPEQRST